MPSVLDRFLSSWWPEFSGLRAEVNALKGKVEAVVMEQAEVDAKFEVINGAISGIRKDIDDIKGAVTPGEPMSQENFDKLSAVADRLAALDAENPATT